MKAREKTIKDVAGFKKATNDDWIRIKIHRNHFWITKYENTNEKVFFIRKDNPDINDQDYGFKPFIVNSEKNNCTLNEADIIEVKTNENISLVMKLLVEWGKY